MFKPGQSGNPKGRPIGSTSYKTLVQESFIEVMQSTINIGTKAKPNEKPYYEAFLETLKKAALSPNSKAFTFMAERLLTEGVLDDIDRSLTRARANDDDYQSYRILKRGHDIQQKVLLSLNKKIYLMAGRRSGKTECNLLKAIMIASTKSNANVLIICLTQETCMKLYYKAINKLLDLLGWTCTGNKIEGLITLSNGSIISLKGNNSTVDREKFRGSHWDLVVIDEAQSQTALPYLINDIIEPMLLDTEGTLILSGTGPRVKGTYWEKLWIEDTTALKINWNLSANPFIKNYQSVLEDIKKTKGLTDESPLYQREYLGLCVYDTDAQVFPISDKNYYTEEEFKNWINSQPVSDIKFTSGLDYGYADSDAFVIICYSSSRKEKFVIYEYKANRTGITELYQGIKKGLDNVMSNPIFNRVSIPQFQFADPAETISKDFYIFCDTNEQKISQEFRTQYNLPTTNAYKYDKNLAIDLLQEEVRLGNLKITKGSIFEDETFKTIWARNDKDELTRKIDDDNFHPDMMDAIIYSLRWIWKYADTPLI